MSPAPRSLATARALLAEVSAQVSQLEWETYRYGTRAPWPEEAVSAELRLVEADSALGAGDVLRAHELVDRAASLLRGCDADPHVVRAVAALSDALEQIDIAEEVALVGGGVTSTNWRWPGAALAADAVATALLSEAPLIDTLTALGLATRPTAHGRMDVLDGDQVVLERATAGHVWRWLRRIADDLCACPACWAAHLSGEPAECARRSA